MKQEADLADVFAAMRTISPTAAPETIVDMHQVWAPDYPLDAFAESYREFAKNFPDEPACSALVVRSCFNNNNLIVVLS